MKQIRAPWLLFLPLAVGGLLLAALLATARPARATPRATCQVPSATFPTIQAALDNAGCDIIALGSQTYGERLTVNRAVLLVGNGATATILDVNSSGTIVQAQPGANVTLRGLTLREGRAFGTASPELGLGGGIFIAAGARVQIEDAVLDSNLSDNDGGAIVNAGHLTVLRSTFVNNRTLIGRINRGGGAILNAPDAHATLIDSTLQRNTTAGDGGGAIFNQGTLTLTNSAVLTNSAAATFAARGRGGAIYQTGSTAALYISGSQLNANTASDSGGAIFAEGTLVLRNSTLAANRTTSRGGALYAVDGQLAVENSAFFTNQAGFGGGAIFLDNGSATIGSAQMHNNRAGSDGQSSGLGGALAVVNARLALSNSVLESNRSGLDGGGVWSIAGQMAISDTRIADNYSDSALGRGGGLFLIQTGSAAALTMTRGTIVNNRADRGGGLYVDRARLTLIESVLRNNSATSEGGGLWGRHTLTATLSGGSVQSNTSGGTGGGLRLLDMQTEIIGMQILSNTAAQLGGGLFIDGNGHSTLTRVRVGHNRADQGGGLFNTNPLTVTRAAFYANSATAIGGGVFNSGSARISNSTLSANAAGTGGGGLQNISSDVTLDSVTIAQNSGGGLRNTGGFVLVRRSIVATNSGGDCQQASGSLTSQGSNIDSDDSCSLTAAGDRPGVDPRLGPLADNGGNTLTHDLRGGSPALDAIPPGDCQATDQRGRPRPVGPGCDIGAFESEAIFAAFTAATLDAYEETGAVTLSVALNRPTPVRLTLGLAAIGGTAQPADYTLAANEIVIPVGQQRGTLTLTPVDDALAEPSETLVLQLQPGAGARPGVPDTITVRLFDNDQGVVAVRPAVLTPPVGSAGASVTLTLDAPLAVAVTVTVATQDSSAFAGREYVALTRTVSFAPGVTTVPVTVQLLAHSNATPRDFLIVLRNPQGPTIGNGQTRVVLPPGRTSFELFLPLLRVPQATGDIPLPDL